MSHDDGRVVDMETTTETRWIRDADGSYTEYADLDEFYDAMFERGITNPGPEGYVEYDGRIVVSWGRSYRGEPTR